MMKKNTKNIILILIFLCTSISFSQTTKGSRPNVIVILADDLGYADVSFNRDASYPEDRGPINTPSIDRLANNGVILKNSHVVHPFCGPSRVAILTGIYPHRIGAQYNLPNDITTTLGIPESETYFSKVLQDADYNTAAFGKWHLGFQEGKFQPLDRGFDYFFGFLGGGKGYFEEGYEDSFYRRQGTDNPVINEYQDPIQRNRSYVDENEFSDAPNEDYLTDVLTDDAIKYIQENKGKPNPYFIYLAYNAPHTPLEAKDAEIAKFKADNPNFESNLRASTFITQSDPIEKMRKEGATQEEIDAKIEEYVEARIIYATMTVNMDANIGRIVDELKKDTDDFNNTVIIFLSDNGGYRWSKGADNFPLDSQKGSVKEGGHRVPMFIHWPNKISSPFTYNYQVSSLDLYPTLAGLAGATIPETKKIDGKDFMDKIISNQKVREDDDPLYVMRPQNGFHNAGVISYPYKMVKLGGNGAWKLYNINTDPGEQTDIRSSEPNGDEIVQNLLDKAIDWVREFKDVKPAWFDHERGDGHPHRTHWFETGVLPGYDRLFETTEEALSVNSLFESLFTIYPNPVSETFTIKLNQSFKEVEVEILSMSGKVIKKITSSSVLKKAIDVTSLSSGVYIVRVKADKNLSVERILKL